MSRSNDVAQTGNKRCLRYRCRSPDPCPRSDSSEAATRLLLLLLLGLAYTVEVGAEAAEAVER